MPATISDGMPTRISSASGNRSRVAYRSRPSTTIVRMSSSRAKRVSDIAICPAPTMTSVVGGACRSKKRGRDDTRAISSPTSPRASRSLPLASSRRVRHRRRRSASVSDVRRASTGVRARFTRAVRRDTSDRDSAAERRARCSTSTRPAAGEPDLPRFVVVERDESRRRPPLGDQRVRRLDDLRVDAPADRHAADQPPARPTIILAPIFFDDAPRRRQRASPARPPARRELGQRSIRSSIRPSVMRDVARG